MELKKYIRDVPDYPIKGVSFKDITTLLNNPDIFSKALDFMQSYIPESTEVLASIESRGFIFGSALSDRLKLPNILLRKKGKLPPPVIQKEYKLEYGIDYIEAGASTLPSNKKIMIIDDLIATGGSANASEELLTESGNIVLGITVLIKLDYLSPDTLFKKPIYSVATYD
tara:strand:+ start:124 stop:633 length:510 start_codon:yes stop_codon:yes gene_type:complete